MSGNVTPQKLHNRVFDAYEAKSLVFESITLPQQQVMKQYNGVIPPMHPVGQPLLIDSWAELVSQHKSDNVYQLLPRRARNNEAYSIMRAICSSAQSPFTMENRVDPIDYKLTLRAADMELRNQFNANNQDKVPNTIWFDGILKAPNTSALISFHPSLSPASVNNLTGSEQFLRQFIQLPNDGDRHRQLKELYAALLKNPVFLFLGTNSTPSRELLNYARSKKVFIYAKKGMRFVYQV